jgi:hypothetical protein
VQVDYRGGQLSATLPASSTWVSLETTRAPSRYRANLTSREVFLEFETVSGIAARLILDSGAGQPKMNLVRVPWQ